MLDATERGARLRRLEASDLGAAQRLSTEVGWPHRLEDWEFVHRLGRGFALTDASDALVGTALWWPLGSSIATLGMVIVSPQWQRRGFGQQLLTAVLDEIGPRTTFLNGTRDGLRLYERAGFRAAGTVRQYRGKVVSRPNVGRELRGSVRPVEPWDLDAIIGLDEVATGIPRASVLRSLLELAAVAVLERAGEIAGFACFRRFGRGFVVGPVIAADEDGARALIEHWLDVNVGSFVRIDVYVGGRECWDWLPEAGLARAGEVTTMVRGAAPERSSGVRAFGLINQAMC